MFPALILSPITPEVFKSPGSTKCAIAAQYSADMLLASRGGSDWLHGSGEAEDGCDDVVGGDPSPNNGMYYPELGGSGRGGGEMWALERYSGQRHARVDSTVHRPVPMRWRLLLLMPLLRRLLLQKLLLLLLLLLRRTFFFCCPKA